MRTPVAHTLYFNWTGWPGEGTTFPVIPDEMRMEIPRLWQADGLDVSDLKLQPTHMHITFRTLPDMTPLRLATRAKGRLQHAFHQRGLPVDFSRKLSLRSLGYAGRKEVERYLADQLLSAGLADPRYRESLAACAWDDARLDLRDAAETTRGRYWYDLHFVLVTEGRHRMDAQTTARRIGEAWRDAAQPGEFVIKRLALMPDHAHLLLRGAPDRSPEEIGNRLVAASEERVRHRLWQEGFFVTTVGEYSVNTVLGSDPGR